MLWVRIPHGPKLRDTGQNLKTRNTAAQLLKCKLELITRDAIATRINSGTPHVSAEFDGMGQAHVDACGRGSGQLHVNVHMYRLYYYVNNKQ